MTRLVNVNNHIVLQVTQIASDQRLSLEESILKKGQRT